MSEEPIVIVGGGLAGSEAAWQLARRGIAVNLYEMRPAVETGAHQSSDLAELVCSNSLGSKLPDRASGILMGELRQLDSLLLRVAERTQVPAGGALAVDRTRFARQVTAELEGLAHLQVIRSEVRTLPRPPAIIASGPLTSQAFSQALLELTGENHLYFFDAISPIVEVESINFDLAYRGSRYGRGQYEQGDYINCPLNEQEYNAFIEALLQAERIPLRSFEEQLKRGVKAGMHTFFEGCLPIEILAERGRQSLAFGPMRPVGLRDPRTGRRPHAVVQLRQDNLAGNLYNLVGFQTNLRYPEQRRVLRMIPGLEQARFARYGQMHRNTFLNSPTVLEPTLQLRGAPGLFLAGQITGVEGYLGNIATGLWAGLNAARLSQTEMPLILPETTMLGALIHYVTAADPAQFQPMKANLGLLPSLPEPVPRGRRERARAYAERSARDLARFLSATPKLMRVAT